MKRELSERKQNEPPLHSFVLISLFVLSFFTLPLHYIVKRTKTKERNGTKDTTYRI